MKIIKSTLLILFLLSTVSVSASSLTQQVVDKQFELQSLIDELKNLNIDTYKEELAMRTSEVFMQFATWDEANVSANTEYFEMLSLYKDNASQLAIDLPAFERADVLQLLEESIAYAQLLKEGKVFRTPAPKVDWTKVTRDYDQLTFEGKPVFLADYTWKPETEQLTEFYGNQSLAYIDNNYLEDDKGTISAWNMQQISDKASDRIGFVFIGNTRLPDWATTKYGDDFVNYIGDPFFMYDVDHPGAKEMNELLIDGFVPHLAGKRYTKLGYLMCNEPRWITYKDGDKKVWYTSGVSEYTMVKFRTWLQTKYQDVNTLNNIWKSYYLSFDMVNLDIPIDISKRGTAQWYDWNAFNNQRIVEWFTWMKDKIRSYDAAADVHLKIMPSFFTDNEPCTGIDLEALTELSDINGNDCAAHYNDTRSTPADWQEKYILGWREMYLGYDFLKSVRPNQINFNSESHLLSTNGTRDLYMNPKYVRSVYWAATLLGMDVSQTWYWPRDADGGITRSLSSAYAGSNNQQARVTNELHATLADLNTFSDDIMAFQRQRKPLRLFYSKTSAIQRGEYMDDVFSLYESLNFSGLSLGFVTKNIISQQDNTTWDAVLIYKTERVTLAERDTLQSYLDRGGVIIMDNESLTADEYGNPISALVAGNGTLIKVTSLSQLTTKGLELAAEKNQLPLVSVSESNSTSFDGCVWRCVMRSNGKQVVSLSNYGKTGAQVKIKLNGAVKGTKCLDLINGIQVPSELTLKPYDVLFIEVSDGSDISAIAPVKNDIGATLFPTVCENSFNIELGTFVKQVCLEAYSTSGQLCLQSNYNNVDYICQDVTTLIAGSYIIRISDGADTQTFRISKKV